MMSVRHALFGCFGGALAAVAIQAQNEPPPPSGIFAIVDDVVITYDQVLNAVAPVEEIVRQQYATKPELYQQRMAELIRNSSDTLVEEQLILRDFDRSGYNLPESFIEDEIQRRIKDSYTDRRGLTKTLQAQGITFETFRKRIHDEIILGFMMQKNIAQNLIISPHKIELYYTQNQDKYKMEDQIKLRMIVINKSKDSPDTAKKLAQEILVKLNAGAPFAEMASVYSEGSQRSQGGDWRWADRSTLRKELADTAFSLRPGQRSGVIETEEACWLMEVEDARTAHVKPLSEVRDEIEKTLVSAERARLRKKWIDRLKTKTFVRTFF